MLAKGIHVMHGGGCLSIAHSDEDIAKIIKAARKVGKEMVDSVRSSKF
jgi:glutamate-1-semialdehyde aminotransferase